MNIRKIVITASLLFVGLAIPLFATGASYVDAVIQPVSINNDGVILCKTKFTENSMGALKPMPVIYGWCIILSGREIIEITDHVFYPDLLPYDEEYAHYKKYEQEYKEDPDWKNPSPVLKDLMIKYKFSSTNVAEYRVNKKMSLRQFRKEYSKGNQNLVQCSLYQHISTDYFDTVQVEYAFESIVFVDNYSTIQGNNSGARFNFFIHRFYDNTLLEYETWNITGILFYSKS